MIIHLLHCSACIILTLIVSGCAKTSAATESDASHGKLVSKSKVAQSASDARAATPATCPYGHPDVRNLPVVYGLIIRTESSEKEADDFYRGGCVVSPGLSPAYVLLCSRCKYRFNPVTREWNRISEDPATFERPLNKIIIDFPLPTAAAGEHPDRTYEQEIRDGKVVCEVAFDGSTETAAQVQKRLTAFFRTHGFPIRPGAWEVLKSTSSLELPFELAGKSGVVLLFESNDRWRTSLQYPLRPATRSFDRSAAVKE